MAIRKDIDLFIFDFDGTLLHLDIDWEAVHKGLAVRQGENIGGAIQRLHLAADKRLDALVKAEVKAAKTKGLPKSTEKTIGTLLVGRKRVAIFTRNSRLAVEAVLHKDLLQQVYIVGREDVRMLKPDQEGMLLILRHFEARPEQSLLVGDTYHDVEVARKSGVYSVIVENPRLDYVPSGADEYIKSIDGLLQLV